MSDVLSLTVSLTAAENSVTPTLQPASVLSALPSVSPALFSFTQKLLPTSGINNVQRLTFTPVSFQLTVAVTGTHALLVVDDPVFLTYPGMQVGVYSGTTLFGAVSCAAPYGAFTVPLPYPAVFTFSGSSLTVRTESEVGAAFGPSMSAFNATLYTW